MPEESVPVSYTHLDVYKRQGHRHITWLHGNQLLVSLKVIISRQNTGTNQFLRQNPYKIQQIDVYKRQKKYRIDKYHRSVPDGYEETIAEFDEIPYDLEFDVNTSICLLYTSDVYKRQVLIITTQL